MRAVFANVSTVEYRPTHLPEVPVTPLNAHYQPALALARLILQSGAVELAAGKVESASFLIDMNKVFEDFVVVALRDELMLTEYTFPQEARGRDLRLDEGREVRLKPDLSWWQNDRCVFVGDAKYKRTTVHGAQNHDIYQALAYALAADLPGALLIYAHDDQDRIDHVTYEIPARNKRIEVEVDVLNLQGQPEEILGRVSISPTKSANTGPKPPPPALPPETTRSRSSLGPTSLAVHLRDLSLSHDQLQHSLSHCNRPGFDAPQAHAVEVERRGNR